MNTELLPGSLAIGMSVGSERLRLEIQKTELRRKGGGYDT
jgi:hypothetical protein